MRFRFLAIMAFALLFSCKAKNSQADTENTLKSTMQTYLYNAINNDSSKVKYRVLSVIYYDDKDKYICEFKVNLKVKPGVGDTTGIRKEGITDNYHPERNRQVDTTGIMKADISKDFKKVTRY
jgi:hypothetical protein